MGKIPKKGYGHPGKYGFERLKQFEDGISIPLPREGVDRAKKILRIRAAASTYAKRHGFVATCRAMGNEMCVYHWGEIEK